MQPLRKICHKTGGGGAKKERKAPEWNWYYLRVINSAIYFQKNPGKCRYETGSQQKTLNREKVTVLVIGILYSLGIIIHF